MNKMPLLYKLGRFLLGPIFKIYYNPKIIGKENIPKNQSIIIAGNHIHLYDQCSTIISTKRFVTYMAKKEYFDDKKVAWFFKGVGCIPVDRSKKDEHAVNSALKVLENNGAIGIFPEGTRNKTKEFLLPFKFGAVSMAKKTDTYIVPVGVTGSYKFRSKDLIIRYGKPFKVTNMELEEANKKLYSEVESLMKQNLKEKKKKNGFTLMELLSIIILISTLAVLIIPTVNHIIKSNKAKIYNEQINGIKDGMKNWAAANVFSLPYDGESIELTLRELAEEEYIDLEIKNPITHRCISPDTVLTITASGNNYTYNVPQNIEEVNCDEING